MSYLLDTNACVTHLRSSGQTSIGRKLAGLGAADAVLCSVVKAELIYGVMRSRDAAKNLIELQQFFGHFVSLPFDDRAAEVLRANPV